MATHAFILSGFQSAAPWRTETLRAAIASVWPSVVAPISEVVALDELLARLELVTPGSDVTPWPAVVVIVGEGDARQHWHQMIDRLSQKFVPAIVIVPDADLAQAPQRTGVLVVSQAIDAPTIAGMVYGLLERQDAVDRLVRELRVSQRSHGGLEGEIRRFHEELHLAATVQRALLPASMPEGGVVEFASVFRPVGFVSGDIFDVRPIDDRMCAFFVADAVGHGMPAALLTMALRHSLVMRERSGAGWRTLAPAEVLSRLNRELCRHDQAGHRFATAIYGLVDVSTGDITVAGAGHPSPLVIADGEYRELETDGPLLGVFDSAEFTEAHTTLAPGESFIVYTDGLENAFPSTGRDSRQRRQRSYIDRLLDLARDAEDGLPGSIAAFLSRLDDQSGSLHQVDDITILAMRRIRDAMAKAA